MVNNMMMLDSRSAMFLNFFNLVLNSRSAMLFYLVVVYYLMMNNFVNNMVVLDMSLALIRDTFLKDSWLVDRT